MVRRLNDYDQKGWLWHMYSSPLFMEKFHQEMSSFSTKGVPIQTKGALSNKSKTISYHFLYPFPHAMDFLISGLSFLGIKDESNQFLCRP